jgi:hypothetical protein
MEAFILLGFSGIGNRYGSESVESVKVIIYFNICKPEPTWDVLRNIQHKSGKGGSLSAMLQAVTKTIQLTFR